MSEQDLLALFDLTALTPEEEAYLAEQQAIAAGFYDDPYAYYPPSQISPPSFEGAAGLAAGRPQAVINPQYEVPVSSAPDYDPYAQYTSGANDVAQRAAEQARLLQQGVQPRDWQVAPLQMEQTTNWAEEPMGPPSGGAFSTKSGDVGGGGTYYSDSGGYGGIAPKGSAAIMGGLLGLTPEMRQAGIERENQPGIIGQFLDNLVNTPLLSYPLGGAGLQGPRAGALTLGEAAGAAYDTYMTDIPLYSDFARETLVPAAGDVGAELFDAATPRTVDALGSLLGIATGTDIPTARDVGRFVGEAVVPVTAGDVALELIPGIGTVPDLARIAPDIARQAARGLDAAALRAMGDQVVTVYHIPSSDEGLESILRTGLNPGTAVTTDRELAEAIAERWGFEPLEFQTTASRLVPDAYYQRTTTPLRVGEPAGGGLRAMVGAEQGAVKIPVGPEPVDFTARPADAADPPSVGNVYAAPLRDFDSVRDEVVTTDNPVVKALFAKTGINPSIADTSDVGRALTAYMRQRVAAEELTQTAIAGALDVHAQRFTGSTGRILPISDDGLMTVTRNGVEGQTPWNDVFSKPDAYDLTPAQRAYIADYHQVIDDAEALRVSAGLRPLSKEGDEGWHYVPRQVENIRGIDLRRPSNAHLQRVYEDAVDGYARGIRYDSDPRATLELHVRAAYKEIVEKQLSDAIEPLSMTAKDLVPAPVVKRLEDAIANRKTTERAVRKEIETARKNLARPADTPRQVTLRQRDLAKLEELRTAAGPRLAEAQRQYQVAKNAYTKALESSRAREIAPGAFWGREGEIPVAQWRNRFMPREDADRINEIIGRFTRKGEVNPVTATYKAIETVGNMTRFLSAVGDFGQPFIQGLPVLATNPAAWAKSAALHYTAFFDPTVQSRFIRDHLDTFQEMARNGVPVGDPEFFAALREGEGISFGSLIQGLPKGAQIRKMGQAVGKQTFGRFGNQYATGLGSSRALLWEASQHMEPQARAQWIRNLTGGLDSRAIGVGPNQRAVEGSWMAFSPRLFRSTAALVSDAMRPNTPQGRAALRSLTQLASGATGLYVATGFALGKEWSDIEAGLNPLNGKKFLSHEVNGDWIGIGGQIRAIAQLIGESASAVASGDVAKFWSTNQFDNPLVNFYMNRGAPLINMSRSLIEGVSGGKLNANPFAQIDNLPDMIKHIGTSALPFSVQAAVEGQNAISVAAGFLGLRTSPETLTEERNRKLPDAIEATGLEWLKDKEWADMTSAERAALREHIGEDLYMDLEKQAVDRGSIFAAKRQEIRDFYNSPEIKARTDAMLANLSQGGDHRLTKQAVDKLKEQVSAMYDTDLEYQRAVEELPSRDIDKLVDVYYGLDPSKREAFIVGLAELEKTGKVDPGTAERVRFNTTSYVNPDEPEIMQLYDRFEASDLKQQYDALPLGKARLDFRAAHPEFDAQMKALGYVKGDEEARQNAPPLNDIYEDGSMAVGEDWNNLIGGALRSIRFPQTRETQASTELFTVQAAEALQKQGIDPDFANLVRTEPMDKPYKVGGYYQQGWVDLETGLPTDEAEEHVALIQPRYIDAFGMPNGPMAGEKPYLSTVLHEQAHAFENNLTPEEEAELAAIMERNPTLLASLGYADAEYHPGALTRYFDQWGQGVSQTAHLGLSGMPDGRLVDLQSQFLLDAFEAGSANRTNRTGMIPAEIIAFINRMTPIVRARTQESRNAP